MTLSEKAKAALESCFVTRGKNKGALLKNAPPSSSLAYAAWQGAMIVCNPYKVSIAGLMFMAEEQLEVYREVESFFTSLPKEARFLDRDRLALESLGAW
jgi:hypothetical protein